MQFTGGYNQVGASPIFSGHVRVNQWSDFIGRGLIFADIDRGKSGDDFENYAEHTTRFSLFLMSYSL